MFQDKYLTTKGTAKTGRRKGLKAWQLFPFAPNNFSNNQHWEFDGKFCDQWINQGSWFMVADVQNSDSHHFPNHIWIIGSFTSKAARCGPLALPCQCYVQLHWYYSSRKATNNILRQHWVEEEPSSLEAKYHNNFLRQYHLRHDKNEPLRVLPRVTILLFIQLHRKKFFRNLSQAFVVGDECGILNFRFVQGNSKQSSYVTWNQYQNKLFICYQLKHILIQGLLGFFCLILHWIFFRFRLPPLLSLISRRGRIVNIHLYSDDGRLCLKLIPADDNSRKKSN